MFLMVAAFFEDNKSVHALLLAAALLQAQPVCDARCAKQQGVKAASAGDYHTAEPHFARACRLAPREPDACYYWARALYALDRFDESLKALQQAPAGSTKAWQLAVARGQALDALGQPDAEKVLRQALELRQADAAPPAEPEPLLALAAHLYRQGRAGDALQLLKSAPVAFGNLAAYHYQLGRALAQAESWAAAADALENAVSLRPQYPEAHGLLSRCYYRLGDAARGAAHAARAR